MPELNLCWKFCCIRYHSDRIAVESWIEIFELLCLVKLFIVFPNYIRKKKKKVNTLKIVDQSILDCENISQDSPHSLNSTVLFICMNTCYCFWRMPFFLGGIHFCVKILLSVLLLKLVREEWTLERQNLLYILCIYVFYWAKIFWTVGYNRIQIINSWHKSQLLLLIIIANLMMCWFVRTGMCLD